MVVASLVAASLAACTSGHASAVPTGVIAVVAGENFWGDIAAQIGGTHVRVTSIISDPNADPHSYESDVNTALDVARARVVIENGLGYDSFLDKLLSTQSNDSRTVVDVQRVLGITAADANPHVWYDTAALPRVATAFANAFAAADPAHAAVFRANATTFDASLAPILRVIAAIKSKYSGDQIAYTERVPGYLIQAAGLTLGVPATFAQAIEDGNDPSPADTAAFTRAITSRSVKVLLYNGQVTDAQTTALKSLAASSGVPVVGVTETLPKGDSSFQEWQLRQAGELLAALGG